MQEKYLLYKTVSETRGKKKLSQKMASDLKFTVAFIIMVVISSLSFLMVLDTKPTTFVSR